VIAHRRLDWQIVTACVTGSQYLHGAFANNEVEKQIIYFSTPVVAAWSQYAQ